MGFDGINPSRVERWAEAKGLSLDANYRWLRIYSPEDAAELCRQLFNSEPMQDVTRRARDWREQIKEEAAGAAMEAERFEQDH